jgi:phosphoglycolate phosphatase-like HAD superfamily hydrolase
MPIRAVYLDVDGVINDHALNPLMWDAHLGEVLAPVLGATPADWGRVNRKVFTRIWAEQHTWGTDPMTRIRTESRLIVTGMSAELGIAEPSPERCFELWQQVDRHVAGTGEAAFPGTAETIRTLAGSFEVHTATGNPSWRVEALLGALGVRDVVGFPAGPDLVGIAKSEVAYYERVLAATNVEPKQAMIVDDSRECIECAMSAGAGAVHISAEECRCPADFHVESLAKVPPLLESPQST